MFVKSRPTILVDQLLAQLGLQQESVFTKYGVPYHSKMKVKSPFRTDNNPSCTFFYNEKRNLLLKDWATNETFNCIHVVAKYYGVEYIDAIPIIIREYQINVESIQSNEQIVQTKNKSIIKVVKQDFTKHDITYLKSFGLTRALCDEYNIFSIKLFFLNGILKHHYTPLDPILGYYFGKNGVEERWKIYFYKRKKPQLRFMCNTNRIAGWIQLPSSGDTLIITKSLKDVVVLKRMGYAAIAGQSESFVFYQSIIDELKLRFKHIFVLYDNDPTGIEKSTMLCSMFNLYPIFSIEKDTTDTVKKYGFEHTKMHLEQSIHAHISKLR